MLEKFRKAVVASRVRTFFQKEIFRTFKGLFPGLGNFFQGPNNCSVRYLLVAGFFRLAASQCLSSTRNELNLQISRIIQDVSRTSYSYYFQRLSSPGNCCTKLQILSQDFQDQYESCTSCTGLQSCFPSSNFLCGKV